MSLHRKELSNCISIHRTLFEVLTRQFLSAVCDATTAEPGTVMCKRLPKVILLLAGLSGLAACGGPADFWRSYQPNLITDSWSDQGPWGGARWIHWSSKASGTFGENEALAFAKKEGWTCSEAKHVTSEEVAAWVYMREPVFPLVFGENSVHTKDMKRHIVGNAVLIRCDSGWIREPRSGKSSTAYDTSC